MPNLQSRELFACSSNLPLSLLTGLADGLALKDRATRHSGRDSPQLLGPPISVLCVLAEIQRKCARHVSRAPLRIHSLMRSEVQSRTFRHETYAAPDAGSTGHRSRSRDGPRDRAAARRARL